MTDEIQSPAIISTDHVQDRELSPVAGAPKGFRRVDGLAMMEKTIARHQYEAGRRLQEDYAESQMEGGAKSGGQKVDGGRRDYDIPQYAIDAARRVNNALAILTPELLTMTMLFLLPDHRREAPTFENIAARVGRHKRCISFGIETALSLLARHYGN